MKREENPWSKAVVMICTKCGKSIDAKSLEDPVNVADNLKTYLKKSFKDSNELDKIRIVTSSCLDICLDEFQAVSIARTDGPTESWILHPEKEKKELLDYLQKKIRGE